jgi:NADPH:quinone reductase-like Zn-dependent oxidoreductase
VLASPLLVSAVPQEVDAAAALALVRGGLVALCALRAGHFAQGESVLVTAAASALTANVGRLVCSDLGSG